MYLKRNFLSLKQTDGPFPIVLPQAVKDLSYRKVFFI